MFIVNYFVRIYYWNNKNLWMKYTNFDVCVGQEWSQWFGLTTLFHFFCSLVYILWSFLLLMKRNQIQWYQPSEFFWIFPFSRRWIWRFKVSSLPVQSFSIGATVQFLSSFHFVLLLQSRTQAKQIHRLRKYILKNLCQKLIWR